MTEAGAAAARAAACGIAPVTGVEPGIGIPLAGMPFAAGILFAVGMPFAAGMPFPADAPAEAAARAATPLAAARTPAAATALHKEPDDEVELELEWPLEREAGEPPAGGDTQRLCWLWEEAGGLPAGVLPAGGLLAAGLVAGLKYRRLTTSRRFATCKWGPGCERTSGSGSASRGRFAGSKRSPGGKRTAGSRSTGGRRCAGALLGASGCSALLRERTVRAFFEMAGIEMPLRAADQRCFHFS